MYGANNVGMNTYDAIVIGRAIYDIMGGSSIGKNHQANILFGGLIVTHQLVIVKEGGK